MPSDIRPFGAGDGLGFYWIKSYEQFGNDSLELVAIDEVGHFKRTGTRKAFDEAAFTQEEAILEHLAAGIKEADASLDRRRRDAPEPAPEPPPMDRATRRFHMDAD